jgi:ABC-type hemin transport system ATPase subunit
MVELRRASFVRNDRVIVDAVDLRVEPGTITAILGPNGAGKTTLLRLLAGEIPPTSGVRNATDDERYVMLDEPSNTYEFLGEFTRLARTGVGVVAVFDEIDQAAAFADRVVLLESGQLVADGLPEIVLRPDLLQRIYRPCAERARRYCASVDFNRM